MWVIYSTKPIKTYGWRLSIGLFDFMVMRVAMQWKQSQTKFKTESQGSTNWFHLNKLRPLNAKRVKRNLLPQRGQCELTPAWILNTPICDRRFHFNGCSTPVEHQSRWNGWTLRCNGLDFMAVQNPIPDIQLGDTPGEGRRLSERPTKGGLLLPNYENATGADTVSAVQAVTTSDR